MTNEAGKDRNFEISLLPHRLYYIVWTVVFGVVLALGGSILEPFPIPFLNITAASLIVPLIITLNKLVLNKKFSVTAMYAVAGTISIFTTYLGPPTILKPLYIIAGLAFDLATLLRTDRIRFWNIASGHAAITIVGFAIFYFIYSFMVPNLAGFIMKLVLIAAPFHLGVSWIIAFITYRVINPKHLPPIVLTIRSQVTK